MSDDKVLRNIPFDGKTLSYMNWSRMFLSLCTIKNCDDALIKDYEDGWVVSDDADLDPDDEDMMP